MRVGAAKPVHDSLVAILAFVKHRFASAGIASIDQRCFVELQRQFDKIRRLAEVNHQLGLQGGSVVVRFAGEFNRRDRSGRDCLALRSARWAKQRFQVGFQRAVRRNGDGFACLLADQVANPRRQRIQRRPLLGLMSHQRLRRIGRTGRVGHRRTGGTNWFLRRN